MWEREYSAEAEVSAAAIWEVWADVANWGEWNEDIEAIAIDGPFAAGAMIAMTPRGDETISLRVVEARPGELFVDLAELGDVAVRTEHRIEPLGDGRVRVVYRTEISGPGADAVAPELGPAITDDFPQTIAALLARAAS